MKLEKILVETKPAQTAQIATAPLRVAAYCRVSTEKDEQLGSYEIQLQVYHEKISTTPGWSFAGIYADEGITGTNTKSRTGFQNMIKDCEAGKIDYIITKSISRFARNTMECLGYVRHLQSIGVQLIFEKENIDTGSTYSEMLLTVLAAFAQEESRNLSDNLKWGIRKRYEQGIDRWSRIYGYTANESGTYQIVEQEAGIVRMIYARYEHGSSMSQIAGELGTQKIPSPAGKDEWKPSAVMWILRNEKYVGDIMLQKKYTVDHISHKEVRNDCTEIPGYYIKDHHMPIVDRKTYDRVQKIRHLNCQGGRNGQSGQPVQYPFADFLICPYCRTRLRQRKLQIQDNSRGWCCDRCGQFIIKSKMLEAAVLDAYRAALDPDSGSTHLNRKKKVTMPEKSCAEFQEMLRQYGDLQRVDYYWLDDLVDHITFGKHEKAIRRNINTSGKQEKAVRQNKIISGNQDKAARQDIKRSGKHGTGSDDRTITVFWKCGWYTTVPSGISKRKDMPQHLAALYARYQERQKEG